MAPGWGPAGALSRPWRRGSDSCLLLQPELSWRPGAERGGGPLGVGQSALTLLALLLWNRRARLLGGPAPDSGLLQGRAAAHHGAWSRVSWSHRTRWPALGQALSKGDGSNQGVGVSGVEVLLVVPQRWRGNTA